MKLSFGLDRTKRLNEYVRRIWTAADGLPENAITSIIQTRDGYLWVGTPEGLSRFNGKQFTVFDQENTPSLRSNTFLVLLEDNKEEALWMGSYSGGLIRYSHGQWRAYTVANGLPDDYVISLANDGQGNLWVGTAKGLGVMRSGKFSRDTDNRELAEERIEALVAAPDGGLWAAADSHVFKLNSSGKLEQTQLEIPSPSALFVDREGTLWIGTGDQGIYSLSQGKLNHFAFRELVGNRIGAISQDAAGNLWIGMFQAGVCRMHGQSVECLDENDGLAGNNVSSLFIDRENSVWVGTFPGGLTRLTKGKFTIYNHNVGLSQDLVFGLSGSADGSIWAATMYGLSQIYPGHIKSYYSGPKRSDNIVSTIAADSRGNIWVGTLGGLQRLLNGKLVRSSVPKELANVGIRSMLYDRAGELWMGTIANELVRLKAGELTTFSTKDGIASTFVHSIFQDHEGALWFATDIGFSEFQNGKFTNYLIPTKPGKVPGGSTCIHEDRDHVLWIGTFLGLIRFEHGESQLLKMNYGPLSTALWSILEDSNGYFWMSSSRGLFRVRRSDLNELAANRLKTIHYTEYTTVDGLASNDFNGGSQSGGWKGNDGKLYFAESGGVVMVDPEHMPVNTMPPRVVVESVTSEGEAVEDKAELVGKRDLQFRFAALSFVAPEHIRYEYRLEGYDRDWIASGNSTVVEYLNLPRGSYRFRVMASNNEGIWNEAGATFEVVLKPFFYQTSWFVFLCALGCVLAGIGINAMRIRRLKAKERRLLALVEERTRALSDALEELERQKEAARAASEIKRSLRPP